MRLQVPRVSLASEGYDGKRKWPFHFLSTEFVGGLLLGMKASAHSGEKME
jgi:hypothetical protein